MACLGRPRRQRDLPKPVSTTNKGIDGRCSAPMRVADAPYEARVLAQVGPARILVRSSTLMPLSGRSLFGAAGTSPVASCGPVSGRVTNNTDCNDAVATTYLGAPELCNGADDNCNTLIDDGVTTFRCACGTFAQVYSDEGVAFVREVDDPAAARQPREGLVPRG